MKKTLEQLAGFIGFSQRKALEAALRGEEKEFFQEKIAEFAERIRTMPKTYEQDGKGKEAVVFLHYFQGGADIYIAEKDMGEEQIQAFGLVDLGYGPELGYVSIQEILEAGAELDLHFEPKTIRELKTKTA